MGGTQATKEVGPLFMEQSNQTKGKRWLRPQRPVDFKSSTRCQIKMEMDTRGARSMERNLDNKI